MIAIIIVVLVDIGFALAVARLIFKDWKSFVESLYWISYPDILSVWSKKKWEKDVKYSFKMESFVLLLFLFIRFADPVIYKWF